MIFLYFIDIFHLYAIFVVTSWFSPLYTLIILKVLHFITIKVIHNNIFVFRYLMYLIRWKYINMNQQRMSDLFSFIPIIFVCASSQIISVQSLVSDRQIICSRFANCAFFVVSIRTKNSNKHSDGNEGKGFSFFFWV